MLAWAKIRKTGLNIKVKKKKKIIWSHTLMASTGYMTVCS